MKLPKGWKKGRFGELATFRNGLNFVLSDSGDVVSVVGVKDFQRNFSIGYENLEKVRIAGRLSEDDLLRNDDLLFVRSNGNKALVGRCLLIKSISKQISFSGFTIRARLRSADACSTYLGYYFHSGYARRKIDQAGGGTNIANLSQDVLASIDIPLPPLPEQRKIAEILGAWDDGLETLDALIAAKERRKKGLMQRLLTGKRRVKGIASKWATFKLGQLFSERVEQNRADLPLLAITADRGVLPRDELSKRDTSSEDKSKYLRIVPGDIGYNTMRMWQGVSALSALEGIISPAYTVCIPSGKIDGCFAAHFFKLPHTIHLFRRHSQGLVDDTLNLKYPNFATIEVRIPTDVAEQRAIADMLDACDEELCLLRDQRAAVERQKRGLMQRLLTGRVRTRTHGQTRTDKD